MFMIIYFSSVSDIYYIFGKQSLLQDFHDFIYWIQLLGL